MSPRARLVVLLPALAGMAVLLGLAMAGLPDFGHHGPLLGDLLSRSAVPQRHAQNSVAATVFDYRGFDTMGEEFILFGAVTGVVMLLRDQAEEPEDADRGQAVSAALRVVGVGMLGPALVIGGWLAAFGYITPGGGFQAGVLLSGATLLVFLAGRHRLFMLPAREGVVDPVESAGAAAYVAVGLAALVSGAPFLHNLLGKGAAGTLLSAGSIGLLNWATAIEVAAANVLLYSHFLGAHVAPLMRGGDGAT
jgi:multicomponent Na+:H+ antiporter subunit B